jgi:hypothetical protein
MRTPHTSLGPTDGASPNPLPDLQVTIGSETFRARLRSDLAPETCGWFSAQLPLRRKLLHARWSGEACWAPLGGANLGLPHEAATAHPVPGDALLYAGGLSEPEILIPYGPARFASKAGALAGNPLFSIVEGRDRLAAIGRAILWQGAMDLEVAVQPVAEDSR